MGDHVAEMGEVLLGHNSKAVLEEDGDRSDTAEWTRRQWLHERWLRDGCLHLAETKVRGSYENFFVWTLGGGNFVLGAIRAILSTQDDSG